jgi:S-formylglutathione hydrolase
MTQSLELVSSHKQFEGFTNFYKHQSEVCKGPMNFAVYLPPQAKDKKLPVLYWLSGLTCTEQIFMTEAQAQGLAKKYELILVAPDSSPRNTGIEGESESYDLGTGASFYVDATQSKWAKNFQMYSYVTKELREVVEANNPVDSSRRGIFGHSMGGHGALVLGLRNPDLYHSISAFAPICAPSKAPWGIKAFGAYLGENKKDWAKYDANELVKTLKTRTPMLIDQGLDDEFLSKELFTDEFENTLNQADYPVKIRRQSGYDHSYFFISTFIEDHLAFHAQNLNGRK